MSKTEINGVLVLLPLTLIFLFVPTIYRNHFGIEYNTYEEDKRLLDSLVLIINNSIVLNEQATNPPHVEHFNFNPNQVKVEEMLSLGIPHYLANRIQKFRVEGGVFKTKSALKKIYGFPDSLYQVLDAYIEIPVSKSEQVKSLKKLTKAIPTDEVTAETDLEKIIPVIVDLSIADTSQLKKIKGIGSSYAKRIVGYRDLLGGYSSINQLKEVYGFTDSLFNALASSFIISDTVALSKIKINIASFKELNKHPYISFEQTKDILNSKSKSGKFRKVDDLYRLTSFDSLAIEKIAPYLDFK